VYKRQLYLGTTLWLLPWHGRPAGVI